jgi:cytochrome c oxidase subunit 2
MEERPDALALTGVASHLVGIGGSLRESAIEGLLPVASSPQARAIASLFNTTFVVCGVILAIVCGLIGYAIWKFRARSADEAPVQIEGNTRLEIAWTVAPFLVVVFLFVLSARAMSASDPPADREPDLVVTAHQWWWDVKYKSGAITANEIHIPTGTALVVRIESADVVHDFWVPELARKIDATPGRHPTIWMQADAPGTYLGTCAEYCGAEHAWMRIVVVAQSPEEFAVWEERQLRPARAPSNDASLRGARLFADKTCVKCHAIAGNGENARVGPDLTHLADRATLGAGVIGNTPGDLARWLKDPQRIKPGSHMPGLKLDDAQVADMVAYFSELQ